MSDGLPVPLGPGNINREMRRSLSSCQHSSLPAGIGGIASGDSSGWLVSGFFGTCFLLALFGPRLPRPGADSGYKLLLTADEVACEHPKRRRESIRWEDVNRIWCVTTSAGPRVPDEWILLEGDHGGCSFPTEAAGMEHVWDELKQRFTGFDYKPLIQGATADAKHLCWERRRQPRM